MPYARAVHLLSEESTEAYEGARETVARFIDAESREIAFVRNATEALNIVAATLRSCGPVAAPLSEHHSNLLPWRPGELIDLEILPSGRIDLDDAEHKLSKFRPRLVSFSTVSNALGTRQPVDELIAMARKIGACVLLDISQSVGHEPLKMHELDCDFACFSGHKMLGPSGIGVLYQREGSGITVSPLLVGGSMISEVHRDSYVVQPFPWCMEAGTPNIEGVIGLAAACEYLESAGLAAINDHCKALTSEAREGLLKIPGLRIHGGNDDATDTILAFSIETIPAHGIARMLSNRFGIMVRSGHHCAQPLHEVYKLPESVRLSVHLYNTHEEMEFFVKAVSKIAEMLAGGR
ncbi:MAG: aminotransferase class V-fold PLP-dependent enzyme [Planctomycetota bacterium]|jgi:cysteine desulfurase/selenocysteine lyase